jgi:histidine decarboxylase
MKLDISFVNTYSDGQINLEHLEAKLIEHITHRPNKGIMMIVNIGTTITGAIDNVREVRNILDRCTNEGKICPYTIHADAACYGMIIPVTKPFGEVKDYFKDLGITTMTISGHKFLGTNILGIALTTKNFLDDSFIENSLISYCGNIDDITISGCRSGLNVLWLHNTLLHLKLDSSTEIIEKIIQNNLVNASYFYEKLVSIVGENNVFWNKNQFNIVFPMPTDRLIKKYKLMPATKDKVVACTQISVDKELIDTFINEYKADFQLYV